MAIKIFVKFTIGALYCAALFGAPLFLAAGTLDWPRGWVFVGAAFVAGAVTTFGVYRTRPELLAERSKFPIQKGQPLADKVLIVLIVTSFFGLLVFIALDVFRFRLLGGPGLPVAILGLVLFAFGWAMQLLAARDNAFAAVVVRHQTERHQVVVDWGVYAIVRHPMYAGAIPLFVGMALWLGSYAGALLAAVPMAILVVRILVEERLLRRELEGYEAYTRKVPWRLVPFVW